MPTLDVADIISSPEFQTSFVVSRRIQTVNPATGLAAEVLETGFPQTQFGVVTPASGKRLVRNAEGENVVGDIQVVTKFRLSEGDGSSYSPDIVTWKSQQYWVAAVNDYSEFGAGFIVATCLKKALD